MCNGTQSDNCRLPIFAFCVNFHGKIIDALACQGFSMAAYLLKLWFLARFAARCLLLLAVSLFIVRCLQNMKQCMEKTLILWLSKTISTAKAAATAATFSAVHWPLGAGACNFVYLCFEFELPNAKSVQLPLHSPSPHSHPRQLHAMTRIRCTFHSYFLRLTPAWSQAKPRRGGVSGFMAGFLAGIFKPHHTRVVHCSLTNFKCTWLFAPFNAPARMQFRRIKVNLTAFAGGSINCRSCFSHGQNTCSADPCHGKPSPSPTPTQSSCQPRLELIIQIQFLI